MPRRKDPPRRLAKSIKQPKFAIRKKVVQHIELERDERGNLVERIGPVEDEGPAVDWSSCPPDLRAFEANKATTLGFSPDDVPVREAFNKFGLDQQDPWQWRLLLYYLADAHFGGSKKRAQWNDEKYARLLRLSQNYPDAKNDSKILKGLRGDFLEYRRMTEASLRKRLVEARRRWLDFAH
jgi:hypothetical protein